MTGHGLRIAGMHRRSLERFDFDSVLLPYNWVLLSDPTYRGEVEALRDLARDRGVAVQTIKSLARRRWPEGRTPSHSWYEPLADPAAAARSIRWVLAQTDLFLNTSSDADLLAHTLATADEMADHPTPTDAEMAADVADNQIQPLFDGHQLERI